MDETFLNKEAEVTRRAYENWAAQTLQRMKEDGVECLMLRLPEGIYAKPKSDNEPDNV